jgi:hypothetical protein
VTLNHFATHACAAACAHPKPLDLFVANGEVVSKYIVCTSFLGDMVQSNICSSAVGHSGAKGCKRCFVMGTTVAPDGTSLKAARWGGVHHCCPTETIDAEGNPEYSESLQLWNYLTTDSNQEVPHFNRELAATMLVSDEQQAIRARTADDVKAAAQEKFPLPEREALSLDDHVAGALSHMHCDMKVRQVHCTDNNVCVCVVQHAWKRSTAE